MGEGIGEQEMEELVPYIHMVTWFRLPLTTVQYAILVLCMTRFRIMGPVGQNYTTYVWSSSPGGGSTSAAALRGLNEFSCFIRAMQRIGNRNDDKRFVTFYNSE